MDRSRASWQGWAGHTALIASVLRRYNADIATLNKTRPPREGELCERGTGYTFFWGGRGPAERRKAGVGFAVKSTLVGKLAGPQKGVNNGLMTMGLTFSNKQKFITIVSVYHPPWPTRMRSKTGFMKTWKPSSPLFPARINSSYLVILMRELAVTALAGKEWTVSMELAIATATAHYSSRPALNMVFWTQTPSSAFLSATGQNGCILALNIGISSTMSSSGRETGRTCGSQDAECSTDHGLVIFKLNLHVQPKRRPQGMNAIVQLHQAIFYWYPGTKFTCHHNQDVESA